MVAGKAEVRDDTDVCARDEAKDFPLRQVAAFERDVVVEPQLVDPTADERDGVAVAVNLESSVRDRVLDRPNRVQQDVDSVVDVQGSVRDDAEERARGRRVVGQEPLVETVEDDVRRSAPPMAEIRLA